MAVDTAEDTDVAAIVALWERCELTRPWNEQQADIARARGKTNSEVLVGRDGNTIVATVMVGHDGHRGWVYYVAVDPDHHNKGYGRAIMASAEDWLRDRGIEKLQLLVRADNTRVQAFYETLDYDQQERVVYAKWLDGRPMTP
ncbi:MAG TPA: GNAT family acetyltransferase [Afipia sp.]|nr:GNAT family acetyltransferase [Afipia sp.]HAO40401.1 GNAT family acetyltransferase [Afipia sp.]HAP47872.1 GNAT family acetyltransferase [Afipia sp.]HAQ92226.1 GNAT family acetyltransferase [Afipia sp.]HBF53931.1 GNAT family acetyltransferase [Afipia sp.]